MVFFFTKQVPPKYVWLLNKLKDFIPFLFDLNANGSVFQSIVVAILIINANKIVSLTYVSLGGAFGERTVEYRATAEANEEIYNKLIDLCAKRDIFPTLMRYKT